MIYKWNIQTLNAEQKKQQAELSEQLNISPKLSKMLVNRGILTVDEARCFFSPRLEQLHDPFLLPDMEQAVKRIEKALGEKQRILVYGDYDVDGTTSVALVYRFLRRFTSNLDYYIPNRYDEGYGVSTQGIDYAHKHNVKLIIALDCGIKAVEKVEYARSKGIDFIICDHHMPGDELPDAVAVINAKRTDSIYPFEHLSGCGVGFKLVQAFAQSNGIDFFELIPLLDLVAVSIASDIVPIIGENRVLAHYGLKQLNNAPSLGLKGIIDICGLGKKTLTISDIIFKIGPRINASGRMVNGKEAVDLLLASTLKEARAKSTNIDQYNKNRRELDKRITEEALELLEKNDTENPPHSIVLYNEHWHKGVIGIVASRLAEKFYKPTVILAKSNNLITGSARSALNFDVYKAVEACKDLLENFGGHTFAVGLSLKEENISEFKRRFEAHVQQEQRHVKHAIIPTLEIEDEITLAEIDHKFVQDLNKFQPFGPENPSPIFVTRRVNDAGNTKIVGKENMHIHMSITDSTIGGAFPAIAFGQSKAFAHIKRGEPFDICYTIENSSYHGRTFIQLYVKDIQL